MNRQKITGPDDSDPQDIGKPPFRHIHIDGWDIYIGKNDSQNDELSSSFATPWDIWFHVADHPGSHVLIRRPKGREMPTKEILEKVAALAVWFSKARNAPFAKVNYTEARNVHKRKNAPAGEVVVERCKKLKVSPCSPENL